MTAGISGAVWCATRPRSLSARVLESAATLFYITPVYLVGFGVLLLFEPSFGAFPRSRLSRRSTTSRWVIRHHAAPSAYVSVASLVAAWVPTFVTNMVLVEFVLFVPGFFVNTRRALATEDIPMLQALTVWAAVIIVVISTLADLALVLIDPRIRSSGRLPG